MVAQPHTHTRTHTHRHTHTHILKCSVMNACVSAVPQGLMGNKGEPGNPGLPGFSGPKGPAVSTALFLTLPSHVVGERVSHFFALASVI